MNRLALDTDGNSSSYLNSEIEKNPDVTTLIRRQFSRDTEAPVATFAPMHYEAKYAYPLLIWLHGTASNEHELRQVMPLVSMRNYVAVAPRGTWIDPRQRGSYGWRQSGELIDEAAIQIDECISLAMRRFNIHPKRIFLVGNGSGGTMAFRIGWSQPDRFAGVVAINGALPTQQSPLRRINELRQLPCYLATSRESRAYPASRVCRDLRLLHSAGCTVALRQYPGSDGLTNHMLSDLDRWLMELVCGASSNS
jgi:phospholipase/carboxylesterase